jgi:hypothetical protein
MPTRILEPILYVDGYHGIYVPRQFALTTDRSSTGNITREDWAILAAGPDHEFYCDAWDVVSRDALITDIDGNKFTLYQDSDLWLVPVGMEWSEEKDWFVWPEGTQAPAKED